MSVGPTLELDVLRDWIGRTDTATDQVTPRLARELCATLDGETEMLAAGAPAPLAVHWCLSPPLAKTSALGPDGHPPRGGFLPPVALPRRMWAGGGLIMRDRLRVGDQVERRSRIVDVTIKQGRSGSLCFVTIEHEIFTPRGLAIEERQDIAYLPFAAPAPDAAAGLAAAGQAPAGRPLPAPRWRRERQAGAVMLFRYSALTFNGHRIHYDRPYAVQVEAYPGLVVHGPLQANLLLNFAEELHGGAPLRFEFRAMAPLFDDEPFSLCAGETGSGLHLYVQAENGRQTMDAEAVW